MIDYILKTEKQMVPKFTSLSDMLGFLRALPKNANYVNMLRTDFNIEAPESAPAFQKEYLWKYLVQGQHQGKSGEDLMKYAVDGVNKIQKTYYVDLKEPQQTSATVTVVGARRKYSKRVAYPAGTIIFNQRTKRYEAWNGQINTCASSDNLDKLKAKLTKKYGITQFSVTDQ